MAQILAYGYNHLRIPQSLEAPPLGWCAYLVSILIKNDQFCKEVKCNYDNGRVNFYPSKWDVNKIADENKYLKIDIKGFNMRDPHTNGFKSHPAPTL
jgi:hypothetical protein